jgi:choline dehydrogenase-like flavoprotein
MHQDPAGQSFDVVIVGSGASGGWAAKRLTEAGLRVVVLEAGRELTTADYKEHVPAFQLKYRGRTKRPLERERPRQSTSYAVREWNADWFVNDIEEPYQDDSDPTFLWVRTRVVGGRTNVWGRACYRLSDIDFKAASHDGAGVDWPLTYAELAPYYDLVEEYVGVTGMLEALAELPDGKFQPPMGLTCAETAVRSRLKKTFGRTLTQARTANLTRPIHGRAACHYCGPCEHGCVTRSFFNAAFTTMADAVATGRCRVVTGAMAYKVLVDPSTRRARGILYIDRATRQPKEIFGRVVALCAQTMESVRIAVQLCHQAGSRRTGKFERRAWQVPHDPLLGLRRGCRSAGPDRATVDRWTEPPVFHAARAIPQSTWQAVHQRISARVRDARVLQRRVQLRCAGDRRRV